nr:hypothetical protein Iba_chr06dCG3000 [Ipomoea batatas]
MFLQTPLGFDENLISESPFFSVAKNPKQQNRGIGRTNSLTKISGHLSRQLRWGQKIGKPVRQPRGHPGRELKDTEVKAYRTDPVQVRSYPVLTELKDTEVRAYRTDPVQEIKSYDVSWDGQSALSLWQGRGAAWAMNVGYCWPGIKTVWDIDACTNEQQPNQLTVSEVPSLCLVPDSKFMSIWSSGEDNESGPVVNRCSNIAMTRNRHIRMAVARKPKETAFIDDVPMLHGLDISELNSSIPALFPPPSCSNKTRDTIIRFLLSYPLKRISTLESHL